MELERLDLQHELYLALLDGRLYLAPIDDPQKILDIGTGTGVWATDMAERFPKAEVIGTDLSPVQTLEYVAPHLGSVKGWRG